MAIEPTTGTLICLTGAECTGKTTLARQLADALGVPLAAEAARGYLTGRTTGDYGPEDLLAIAELQMAAEARALGRGEGVAVADTDLVVIAIWWQERFGDLPELLTRGLEARSPRIYLLTEPDLSWQPDPLRESPHDRDRLTAAQQTLLDASPFPVARVGGLGEARLARARAVLAGLRLG